MTFLLRLLRRRPKAVVLIGLHVDAFHNPLSPIIGRDGNIVGWRKP